MHRIRELMLVSEARASSPVQAVRFSPRGKKVMELFMRGHTYKKIAERLGTSLSGVRRYQEKMLRQNECKSMLELIAKYQAWLVETDSDDAI